MMEWRDPDTDMMVALPPAREGQTSWRIYRGPGGYVVGDHYIPPSVLPGLVAEVACPQCPEPLLWEGED